MTAYLRRVVAKLRRRPDHDGHGRSHQTRRPRTSSGGAAPLPAMSRLYRGLWLVMVRRYDPPRLEVVSDPMTYEDAERYALMLAADGVEIRASLQRIPGTVAPWEVKANFEASDPPRWN